jgi:predicted DNA-binding transcriptional regulator AlpA
VKVTEIAARLGMSRMSVYRVLNDTATAVAS